MKLWNVAACLLAAWLSAGAFADDPARFDLTGPRVDVRVTRGGVTLPIAQVPNLQAGDKIWVKADLPSTQSNHLLLIVAFLRGTTNEPPDNWFTAIDTWEKKTVEGTTITVPEGAEQAVMFIAPETSGDFKTLRSAVKGRPGLFIRADADLNEASFQQQRIQRYLAAMKEVAGADEKTIQDHSAKLAATLALRPNADCFKQPLDQQVSCLTIASAPVLLDDGHGQSIAEALSTGASSDFINAASYTQPVGGGEYSAYVGAVVDLVHLVSLLGTAQYQYIPGIAFPEGATLNLKLNAPPSFHNPKSVIVIALPAIQKAIPPPLHVHDVNQVECLLQPKMTLPLEGAPLVFSTGFAHDLVLHLNRTGAATDLPLKADAFNGGLMVTQESPHRPLTVGDRATPAVPAGIKVGTPSDVIISGTIHGYWGFDAFDGPTLSVQQLDGKSWKLVGDTQLFAGKDNHLTLKGDGTACVQHIELTRGKDKDIDIAFKPATEGGDQNDGDGVLDSTKDAAAAKEKDQKSDKAGKDAKPAKDDAKSDKEPPPAPARLIKNTLTLDVSLKTVQPGGYALGIRQYGGSSEQKVPLTAYSADISFDSLRIHAGDSTAVLSGKGLENVVSVEIADRTFTPVAGVEDHAESLSLHADAAVSPKNGSEARVKLKDGRTLPVKVSAAAARPSLSLVSLKASPSEKQGTLAVTLSGKDDIPLHGKLTFIVRTSDVFPRGESIEVATLDGSVHTNLSIASNTLILEDEHTAVATLDPLQAFGESAFGKLEMRPVAADGTTGDWIALGTLVRIPQITAIDCNASGATTCTVTGARLFLAQAFSGSRDFSAPTPVPSGFADDSFQAPLPADGSTLYLKLRDDPSAIASVTLPAPLAQPAPAAAVNPAPAAAGKTAAPPKPGASSESGPETKPAASPDAKPAAGPSSASPKPPRN